MNVRTLIGQAVHRAEDFRFLKGAGAFIDDLKREGMLHAVVLRSPVAHGRIRRIDASAARAHAGRACGHDGGGYRRTVPVIPLRLANLPEFKNYLQPVIAQRQGALRRRADRGGGGGDARRMAEDALEAIELDIERLPALPDRHAAAADKSLLFDGVQQPRGALRGDVRRRRRGLRQGANTRREGNIRAATA